MGNATESLSSARAPLQWRTVVEALTRPYPVTLKMLVLVSLIPLYILIPVLLPDRTLHVPEIALDRLIPVQPIWSLVYGPVYLFLILLPILLIRQKDHIDRTVSAYLTVWITAYVFFVFYPTLASRPAEVVGNGFGAWSLRALYSADPPYNCFPSLHVAHSFVSALTCYRLHRNVGLVALVCASLVALSTLFTKQHYILDLVAGVFMAWIAYILFLRGYSRERIPELDRRVAPVLVIGTIVLVGVGILGAWVVYRVNGLP